MEKDSNGKKRARGVMELVAKYAALKGSISAPILYNIRLGARSLRLFSTGKCVCGLFDDSGVSIYSLYIVGTRSCNITLSPCTRL